MTLYALVDCNSFYCSCERLFRPDLKNKPVGVLSNNDGCFVSRSKELKALGIEMGAAYFKVKELCRKNNVAVFSSNFPLYTNISDRVMNTLASFVSKLEVYSVDEAFLDLSGFEKINLDEYAQKIKSTVEQTTGIPVSIGIGKTKTLAKIANNLAKKSSKAKGIVVLLNEKHIDVALEKTKISDVWGIGRAQSEKLHALGIKTALDFRNYKNEKVILKLLTKVGLQRKHELMGQACFELEVVPNPKKEIMVSRTFSQATSDITTLRQAVANYIWDAAQKMRRQNSVCAKLEIFGHTSPYAESAPHYGFEQIIISSGTSDTLKLIRYAYAAVERMFFEGYEYKKAGVKLSNLVSKDESQLSLLEENDTPRSQKLMEVVDLINKRNGPLTIKSMACGVDNESWKMNQKLASPSYVTGYGQLPKVL